MKGMIGLRNLLDSIVHVGLRLERGEKNTWSMAYVILEMVILVRFSRLAISRHRLAVAGAAVLQLCTTLCFLYIWPLKKDIGGFVSVSE